MKKDPRVYLAHILECIQRIGNFTLSGQAAFLIDEKTQHAVMYNLEVMGEAAKRVGDKYRSAHPEIPWRSMTALRDVLIPLRGGGYPPGMECDRKSSTCTPGGAYCSATAAGSTRIRVGW